MAEGHRSAWDIVKGASIVIGILGVGLALGLAIDNRDSIEDSQLSDSTVTALPEGEQSSTSNVPADEDEPPTTTTTTTTTTTIKETSSTTPPEPMSARLEIEDRVDSDAAKIVTFDGRANGTEYRNAIKISARYAFCTSTGSVSFDLSRSWARFVADLALDDTTADGALWRVTILLDGEEAEYYDLPLGHTELLDMPLQVARSENALRMTVHVQQLHDGECTAGIVLGDPTLWEL